MELQNGDHKLRHLRQLCSAASQLPVLELVAGTVGNESGGDGHELRQHLQIVLLQGCSSFHNVHNHVGEAQNGRKLNGAVEA